MRMVLSKSGRTEPLRHKYGFFYKPATGLRCLKLSATPPYFHGALQFNQTVNCLTNLFDSIRFGDHSLETIFEIIGHDRTVGVAA